ncbi:MAG TPA: type II secretion system protein N [Gammaproteobacteria bacterium]
MPEHAATPKIAENLIFFGRPIISKIGHRSTPNLPEFFIPMHAKTQSILRRLPEITCIVLIVGIIYLIVALTENLLTHPPKQRYPVTASGLQPNRVQNFEEQLHQAIESHMFGVSSSKEALNTPITDASALGDLKIEGIIFSEDATNSRVLFGSAQGSQIVGVGATLPNGPRIQAIHAQAVLIEKSGRIISVPYPMKLAAMDAHFTILPVGEGMLPAFSRPNPVRVPTNGNAVQRMQALRQAVLKSMKQHGKDKTKGKEN